MIDNKERDRKNVRKLATAAAVSVTLAAMPGSIRALSLGDIEMYSVLNQPLDAEIGILSATPEELQGMVIRSSMPENYSQRELGLAADMRFRIERGIDGKPVIKISSDRPVIEPFLNFTMTVDSGSGKQLEREFTVLLDPPVFASNQGVGRQVDLPQNVAADATPEAGASAPINRGNEAARGFASELAATATGYQDTDLSLAESVRISESDIVGRAVPEMDATDVVELPASDSQTAESAPIETSGTFQPQVIDTSELADVAGTPTVDATDTPIQASDNATATALPAANTDAVAEAFEGELVDLSAEVLTADDDDLSQFGATFQVRDLSYAGINVDLDDLMQDAEIQQMYESQSAMLDSDASADDELLATDVATVFDGPQRWLIGDRDSEVSLVESSRSAISTTEVLAAARDQLESETADTDAANEEGVVIDIEAELRALERQEQSRQTPAAREEGSQQSANADGSQSHTVAESDTLWRLASQYRVRGATTQQMMVALLRSNSDAFPDGNINRMEVGSILRIPTSNDVSAIAPEDALALVRDQNALWREYRGSDAATEVSRPVEGAEESGQQDPAEAQTEQQNSSDGDDASNIGDGPKLNIVGVEDTVSEAGNTALQGSNGGASASNEEATAGIDTEEQISNELQQAETAEAQAEVDKNVDKMKRLITLQESELGELQQQLAEESESAAASITQEKLEQQQSEVSEKLTELQNQIDGQVQQRQQLVDAQADQQLNKLSTDAEVETQKLAAEADELRAQIIVNESEKKSLEDANQPDKAALAAQAKAEKERLLAQAEAEQKRIAEQLEADKASVAEQAALKREEIKSAALDQKRDLGSELTNAASNADGSQLVPAEELASDSGEISFAEQSDASGDAATSNIAEVAAPEQQGFMQRITGSLRNFAASGLTGDRNTVFGIGALLALLGLLAAFFMRRKARVKPPRRDDDAVGDRSGLVKSDLAQRNAEMGANLDTDGYHENVDDGLSDGYAGAETDAYRGAVEHAAEHRTVATPEPSQLREDTLSEADVYIAYGLHGQAEDLLATAIGRDPDNADFHMKLMETYHAQNDGDRFRNAATAYQDRFGADARWPKIAEMGREVDVGNEIFSRDYVAGIEQSAERYDSADDTGGASGFLAGGALGGTAVLAAAGAAAADGLDKTAELTTDVSLERAGDVTADLSAGLDDQAAAHGQQAGELADAVDEQARMVETIDPGEEFQMAELEATGEFTSRQSSLTSEPEEGTEFSLDATEADANSSVETGLDSLADATLDAVDLSVLDDDGTMNLEEVAGDTMSGMDLGNLDFADAEAGDMDADVNLTLDEAKLDSIGDISSDIKSGLAAGDEAPAVQSEQDSGEMETLMDLAKAYLDMGDTDSAASALKEIIEHGSDSLRSEASSLLTSIDAG